ncbi:MAG: hypothetical protein H6835_06805 [Planctomycetes bacterium]|nr:hypothetical protein [Planctomycetota bacterium]
MSLGDDDLNRVQRLRERFLDASSDVARQAALGDYWRDRRDVDAYDRVLGARIGWKWDAALDELIQRGFARADGEVVVDFGCGAGVAARRFVRRFGGGEVLLHDRSPHAMAFAVERLRLDLPGVVARALPTVGALVPDVLLVSHVLSELDEAGIAALRDLAQRSRRVVLVEPGNRPTARRLQLLRDGILQAPGERHVVAPCPHQGACPALASEHEWCHLFATPPPEVFTDGFWARCGKQLGIDLRSLPYSFVAIATGPAPAEVAPRRRPLGRASVTPHEAHIMTCGADGLGQRVVTKRREAALWRALKKRPEQLRQLLDEDPKA